MAITYQLRRNVLQSFLRQERRDFIRKKRITNIASKFMKAVLLDKPGPPSSLRIGEISIPRPGVDEALVRVCATSLNPVDYKVAAQGYDGWRYPHVLGVDVAGVIETMGEGVASWNRGDQVFYHTTWRKDGSYAEFNVAPAHTFAYPRRNFLRRRRNITLRGLNCLLRALPSPSC